MNSFLNRNIASTLFYSNSRNSSNKKNCPFSSVIKRSSNTSEKEISSKLILSLNDRTFSYSDQKKTVNSVFKILYYKEFPNILTSNSKIFLLNINRKAEELIKKNIIQNYYSSEEIKSFIGVGKEKILILYNEDYSFLKESFLNYEKNPKKYQFLKDNTLIHCIKNYNKFIYHKCNNGQFGNFISINKNKDNLYIICVKCKKCYKNNYINFYCNICNKEYYGSLYKKIDINTSNNRDIFLATWKRYHCGLINNEIMKCINCKNYFYYNIKTNKLICQNKRCNFISNPEYIIWKCSKCSKEFNSEVKPFNPYEYRIYKQELFYIILNKNRAKPQKIIKCLNCSRVIDGNNKIIYHDEKCKGELYSGKIFDNNIVVCSKCLYSNYLEDYIWTCPFCNKKISDKKEDNDNEAKNIKAKLIIKSNNYNDDNNLGFSKKYLSQKLSYNKIRIIRNYFKKENETLSNGINTFNNKRNFTRVDYFRALKRNKNIWFDKNTINMLKTGTNTGTNSPIYSLTKNSLNNSNNSLLSQSRNSLQNKDRKTFHSIIIKMKNRMINSKNKKKYFNQTEEDIKNGKDNHNIQEKKKKVYIRTLYLPTKFMSKTIQIDKKDSEKDIKTIPAENRIKIITVEHKKGKEKKTKDKIDNRIIFVRKALTRKISREKFNKEAKHREIKNNKIIDSQKEIKNLRGKYKEKKETINNINTQSDICNKEKATNKGHNYKKITTTVNNENKEYGYDTTNHRKNNIKENKIFNRKFVNENVTKKDIVNFNFKNIKNDNIKNNRRYIKLNLYKNKNNNENINSNQLENKLTNINDNESKDINEIKYNIENEPENKRYNKKKKIYISNKRNNSKTINESNAFSRPSIFQNIIKISSPNNIYVNYKKKLTVDGEKKEKSSKLFPFRTINNNEENENEKYIHSFVPKSFSKSKNNLIDKNDNKGFSSVSHLIKKNLQEFYDNKNSDNLEIRKEKSENTEMNKKSKLQRILWNNDEKNNFDEYREGDAKKEKENDNVSRESNEFLKNRNDVEELNLKENDEEEENDLINELNIKKVIQHFAHRNSVVKILREIGNEDNSNSANKESKQNNRFVLEGLINHVNLISSPEKILLLEKNSRIPIFSDDDYSYYENIGEGSNANVYLIKDKKTNEEFALKKMVCQEFEDLVKIKKKLELINSLNHDNIMKVHKIQFKCLDFTTYAINTIMDKAITDWSNEIKQRAKNNRYYTEKELINIAKQVIDGLAFLQTNNIAHRDIKPQNILIFPHNIYRIADLGEMIEDIRNTDKQLTIRGSASFLSPALKNGLEHNKSEVKHNVYKSDVFSLGYCFLYALSLNMDILEQAREFWGGNKDNKNIEIDIKKYIGNNRYSNQFIDFISKMIVEDETKREDFLGLKKELELFDD